VIKLKKLLKESTWANRKFGEKLPTMADYQKAHSVKEAIGKGMKWEDLKVGTVIDWQPGVQYKVTKLSKNKLSSKKHNVLKSASKHIFADKYDLSKRDFEDSVRRGFIKTLTNVNPSVK